MLQLTENDEMTFTEYLKVELMKMGKATEGDFAMIKKRWDDFEVDGDGLISSKEVFVSRLYKERTHEQNPLLALLGGFLFVRVFVLRARGCMQDSSRSLRSRVDRRYFNCRHHIAF